VGRTSGSVSRPEYAQSGKNFMSEIREFTRVGRLRKKSVNLEYGELVNELYRNIIIVQNSDVYDYTEEKRLMAGAGVLGRGEK